MGVMKRSIPACAGEPRLPPQGVDSPEVYPRVCGGTYRSNPNVIKFHGLSPRVRGNRDDRILMENVVGSIPACAGEPSAYNTFDSGSRVYPRVCGGTAA